MMTLGLRCFESHRSLWRMWLSTLGVVLRASRQSLPSKAPRPLCSSFPPAVQVPLSASLHPDASFAEDRIVDLFHAEAVDYNIEDQNVADLEGEALFICMDRLRFHKMLGKTSGGSMARVPSVPGRLEQMANTEVTVAVPGSCWEESGLSHGFLPRSQGVRLGRTSRQLLMLDLTPRDARRSAEVVQWRV